MAKNEPLSILTKIADVTIEDKEFTNRDTGEVIDYKRVIIHVVLDGQEDKVELVPANAEGKSAYKVLKLADNLDS